MKKIALSMLTLGIVLPATSAQASSTITASKVKTGETDYAATILKDTKVMNHGTYGNYDYKHYFSKIKAGTKVVITGHKLVDGYNFFVLKGNRYLPVDDQLIRIDKKLSSNIQSGKDFVTKTEQSYLDSSKNEKFYKEYEAFLKGPQNPYHKWLDGKENTMTLSLIGLPGEITEEAMEPVSYSDWLGRKDSINSKSSAPKVNVLSKQFKKDFFNSKSNIVLNHKSGESWRKVWETYGPTSDYKTQYGNFYAGDEAGFMTTKDGKKVTKLIYKSKKKVSYKDWINYYGKPQKTEFHNGKNIEHILTYNQSKYGYKVIVGFDSYKGYVKYILKEKIK